jgi:hypothetical protein
MLLGVFLWYFLCLGLAALLNLAMRRKFFNGSFVFLILAAISSALQLIFGVLGSIGTEATIVAALYWVIPAIPAAWTAHRFEKEHPFSFPSVIWKRIRREAKARDA